MLSFIYRGIFIPEEGSTRRSETITVPAPEKLTVPMAQGSAEVCEPAVRAGDRVYMGQPIGKGEIPVHSPVSGRVTGIVEKELPSGTCKCVEIENDRRLERYPGIKPPVVMGKESFIQAVKDSGCVGLSGAGYPTFRKLEESNADVLIANGMECEPFLNSDLRCMMEQGDDVIEGCEAVMKWMGIEKCFVAVSGERAEERMNGFAKDKTGITVRRLPAKYPFGSDKVLAYKLTGRLLASGEELKDKGVLVMNVSTLAFIAGFLRTGMPLISRRVTVDGDVVRTPCVVRASVGTPISELMSFAETNMDAADKLMIGGPMMGESITDPTIPVTKTTNGAVAFMKPLVNKKGLVDGVGETACIRCGRCCEACPEGLMPVQIERAMGIKSKDKRKKALVKLRPELCIDCGACTYVCPARRSPGEAVRKAAGEVSVDE